MAAFKQGDIVKVPFPYTDRSTRQLRPALIVSTGPLEDSHRPVWVVMITSAENRGWSGDVPIGDLSLAGLPAPSLIRTAKIATFDAADAAQLGKVSAASLRKVLAAIGREVGFRD